jgi:hypothetical protein
MCKRQLSHFGIPIDGFTLDDYRFVIHLDQALYVERRMKLIVRPKPWFLSKRLWYYLLDRLLVLSICSEVKK